MKLLEEGRMLSRNEEGEYPLHSIVQKSRPKKDKILNALLTHSSEDVNVPGKNGMTALHYAVQV